MTDTAPSYRAYAEPSMTLREQEDPGAWMTPEVRKQWEESGMCEPIDPATSLSGQSEHPAK